MPFKCSICDSSFTQKGLLNEQVASVHEGKKPFKCNICDASFTRKGSLNIHMGSVHKGKKPMFSICDTTLQKKAS